ncbi:hypothetical protein RHGRI_027026 [Rhododendron griersonianum]|uniref:HD domain-containing protein n=1 Tax=Rhododendron griersonianum TaxID=479676 RepID=A0AAV6IYC7_9ERIC|nr:hypothetical protein RHGRI_027026 [Rhododendron griersonianum]
MAANSSSLSLSSHSSLPLNRSLSHRSHQPSPNLPFTNDPPSPRLVSVRAQGGSERAFSVDGFESGSGPKSVAHSDCTEASSSSSAIDFLTLCHRLKTTKRKGWINHGIKGPESIADHMYRMSLMALIVGDLPGVNRERLATVKLMKTYSPFSLGLCIKMAIVHDIAEAIVGDITPSDGVPKEEKSRREQEALNEMCEVLGGGLRAEEIKELWAEYENNSSVEANLVKDFDKVSSNKHLLDKGIAIVSKYGSLILPLSVEMILQALEYEMVNYLISNITCYVEGAEHGKVLDEFFLSTAGKFQTEIGKSWAAEIISRRNSRLANTLS